MFKVASLSSKSKKLPIMKAFIFCATFFFFAAANASPFDNFGYGSIKRSDDQGKS